MSEFIFVMEMAATKFYECTVQAKDLTEAKSKAYKWWEAEVDPHCNHAGNLEVRVIGVYSREGFTNGGKHYAFMKEPYEPEDCFEND